VLREGVGVHLRETPVLVMKLLELGHHRCVHAAVFAAQLVEGRRADAMLAAQVGDGVSDSACLITARIWLSVNQDFSMEISSGKVTKTFHF